MKFTLFDDEIFFSVIVVVVYFISMGYNKYQEKKIEKNYNFLLCKISGEKCEEKNSG